MAITSMLFLFCFLPIALVAYYLSPARGKDFILLVLSLLFYALGSLQFFGLFLIAISITVLLGRWMAGTEKKSLRRFALIAGIVMNAGLLGYYKYSDFAISTLNRVLGKAMALQNLLLPLGISFFTFKAISYLADIYTGKAVLHKNPLHDMLYLSFFAQIQSGPITRYNEMQISAGKDFRKSMDLLSDGIYRFMIGFNKKVLIANVLAHITNEVYATPFGNFTQAYAWLGSICYSLQLFFDFAGYSDMAIGLSEMFGYTCMENFNYPYMTESVAKFWRRWHISLSQWFRDYIYIPLGGSRNSNKFRVYFNLLVVWMLTGIWHGAAWNFIAWGLGYFVLIAFERATGLPERLNNQFLKFGYRILTLLFINFQWVLFRAEGIHQGLSFIKRMFISDGYVLSNARTLFLMKDYALFLIIAVILCFPVMPWLDKKLENQKALHMIYKMVTAALIVFGFVWAISFVVSGQNNPFAYANF